MQIVRIGMAQLAVAKKPDRLETLGLGSCVGIALYSPDNFIGGLSHAMLPEINEATINSRSNIAKFVNSSIDVLVDLMHKKGVKKESLVAKIAGGANMFASIFKENTIHIGMKNILAARAKLKELNIPLIGEDVGGTYGRTIILDISTGVLTIKTAVLGIKEI